MTELQCYHCGLPVPSGFDFSVLIDGNSQAMCCPGCQAIAMAIVDGGFDRFYQYRSQPSLKPEDDKKGELTYYDLAEIQQDFVHIDGEGHCGAEFIINGITCSACAWLIEHHLSTINGVISITVNVSSHRCHISWDSSIVKLSTLLQEFQNIGYQALPAGDEEIEQARSKENKDFLLRLGVAGLGMMQAGMVAIALYAGGFSGIDPEWRSLLRWLSFIIVTPVVFFSARPFFSAALRSLKMRHLVMDVSVSIAIALAYSASVWATITRSGEVYYDSVSMFTFFLLLGRYLEMRVRHNNEHLSGRFSQLIPPVVIRMDGSGEVTVPVKSLHAGDRIRIGSGETIACDGEVALGNGEVNEAVLTGEQRPVMKMPGSSVSAGTVNISNPLEIIVHAIGHETRLANILNLAASAEAVKPVRAAAADRLAGWFVAAVLTITSVVAVSWWFIEPSQALWVTLSVLVVTCPCALSLATPAALTVATGELRKRGFLIRKSHVLETLANVDRCVFDKTGTLTLGNMAIVAVQPLMAISEQQILLLAAALEKGGAHPIARAFKSVEGELPQMISVNIEVGEGVSGDSGGQSYALGKPSFVAKKMGFGEPSWPFDKGLSLLLGCRSGPIGWIQLEDEIRPGAQQAVKCLQRQKVAVELLSGDHNQAVNQLANLLNIQERQGEASPETKLTRIHDLQGQGHSVLMVGDGINDVPVLSAADVSVAMGDAVDLTQLYADSLLVSGNLTVLDDVIVVARKTRTIIRQNMGWALLYNIVALPLACAGLVPPWAAAIGMSLSSLLVVINGLRLSTGISTAVTT